MDNDGAAVPAFNVLPLDYLSASAEWWMFDSSRALSDEQGLQFVEAQAPTLEAVNVVEMLRPLVERLIEKFRKFRETLVFSQTILSQAL